MAISHVCMSCGLDLARVRARVEPYYELPIVVCPDCGWAAVRRSPRARRKARRLLQSVLALLVQVSMTAACLAGLFHLSTGLGDAIADGSLGTLPRDKLVAGLVTCAVFAVLIGAWLTAAFGHLRGISAWLSFSCLGLVVIATGTLLDRRLDALPERCLAMAAIMTVAVGGVPAGMLVRAGWRQVGRAVWRLHRQRLRARSAGR